MQRTPVATDAAPGAIGTYSQGIIAGGMLYVSGQIPLDPATGKLVEGGIEAQIRRVFDNLAAVAAAAGGDLRNAAKVTVFLTDLGHFPVVNEVMQDYFTTPYPARAALGVRALPLGAPVEADAVIAL